MHRLYRNSVVQLSPVVLDLISEEEALNHFTVTPLEQLQFEPSGVNVWLAKACCLERKIKENFPAIEIVKDTSSCSLKVFGLWDELFHVLKVLESHHGSEEKNLHFGSAVSKDQTTQTCEAEYTLREVTVNVVDSALRSTRLSGKYKLVPPEPHRTRSKAKKEALVESVSMEARQEDGCSEERSMLVESPESVASPLTDSHTMTDVLSAIEAVERVVNDSVKQESDEVGIDESEHEFAMDVETNVRGRIPTHILSNHYSVIKEEDSNAVYHCNHCQHPFRELKCMREHLLRKHLKKRFQCTLCSKAFGIKRDLTRHLLIHRCDKTCSYEGCTYRCSKKSEMKSHVTWCHKEGDRKSNDCPIADCDHSTRSRKSLSDHMKRKHGEKLLECSTCDKKFAMRKDLNYHEKKHNDHFVCNICEKVLSSKSSLKMHIKNVHHKMRIRTNKTCLCSICGKLCHNRTYMQAHMNKAHLNLRPYKCTQCSNSFYSQMQCRRHMISHSDERKHVCLVCNKSFKIRRALKIHSIIHTDTRPFKCEKCGKTFTQSSALTRHLRIHSGERPYACVKCKLAFSDSSILRRHLMKKHRDETESPKHVPKKENETQEVIQSSEHGYTRTIEDLLSSEGVQIKIEALGEVAQKDSNLDSVNIILAAAQQSFLSEEQEAQAAQTLAQLQPPILPSHSTSLPQLLQCQTGSLITLADGRQGCIIHPHSLMPAGDPSELQSLLTMSSSSPGSEQIQQHASYSM